MRAGGELPCEADRREVSSIAIAAILVALLLSRAGAAEEDFDHLRSGFPLTGAHERIDCQSCHVRGFFEGTPTRCGVCHGGVACRRRPR